MRKLRSFTDQVMQVGDEITLDDRSAHHLRTVLRVNSGQHVELFNGNGNNYQSTLTVVSKKNLSAIITECTPCPVQIKRKVTLQQALIKPDRMDWVVQKATELGVATIQLLESTRVNSHLSKERLQKKRHHWEGIIISAAEQCGRADIPLLSMPVPIQALTTSPNSSNIVLDPHAKETIRSACDNAFTVAVGPEGGFTRTEVHYLESIGYHPTTMPGPILRAETAAVAAVTLVLHSY